ncbi:DUF2334 domain-containing protein [Pyrococcus horikoshii]|nr:DUF2334 domain-containing protein [Pyrococcus horikoshii]HII61643.1 DUF2334 domain-containing protein [Pyrococcus horikoshii]
MILLLLPQGNPQFIILIHDVSPVYSNYIQNITEIISTYNFQNSTILLVIPNHANEHPISGDPKFQALIRELEKEGYKVGIHGYNHIGEEFNCDSETAKIKLSLAIEELNASNITFERIFLPPRYKISKDPLNVLLENNFTVFLKDRICYPSGTCIRIKEREYTWYTGKIRAKILLQVAKFEYTHTKGVFVLSVHPKAVNYGGGMYFLEEFLKYVREGK